MADELMTQDAFDKLIEDIAAQYARMVPKRAKAAYAAVLARIATLEAEPHNRMIRAVDQIRSAELAQANKRIAELESQLAAQREQIERLLAEAAHS